MGPSARKLLTGVITLFLMAAGVAEGEAGQELLVATGLVLPVGDSSSWAGTAAALDFGTAFGWKGTPWRFTGTFDARWVPFQTPGSLVILGVSPGVEYSFGDFSPGWSDALGFRAGPAWATRASFTDSDFTVLLAVGDQVRVTVAPTLTFSGELRVEWVPGLWQGVGLWAGFDQLLGGF